MKYTPTTPDGRALECSFLKVGAQNQLHALEGIIIATAYVVLHDRILLFGFGPTSSDQTSQILQPCEPWFPRFAAPLSLIISLSIIGSMYYSPGLTGGSAVFFSLFSGKFQYIDSGRRTSAASSKLFPTSLIGAFRFFLQFS